MLQIIDFSTVSGNFEFAERCRQFGISSPDDQLFMAAAVCDQIRDRSPFEIVFFAEFIKFFVPCHSSVRIHDLANDRCRIKSRQTGKIDPRFSVTDTA